MTEGLAFGSPRTAALAAFLFGLISRLVDPAVEPALMGAIAAVIGSAWAQMARVESTLAWQGRVWRMTQAAAISLVACTVGLVAATTACGSDCRSGARKQHKLGMAHAPLVESIRNRSEAALDPGLPPDVAALLKGMTLGDDSSLSEQAKRDFRRASLTHIVAASGQNVSLLVLFTSTALGMLGVGLRPRLLISGIAVLGYVPLAGGEAPIRRACVMGLCALVGSTRGGGRAAVHSLLLAAAVTLLLDPHSINSLGWQLSFAAVAGMMLLTEPIKERAQAVGLPPLVSEAIGATTAATLFTAPLIAATVGQLSLTSIPANLLVGGAVAPVMMLGIIASLVGQVSGFLAAPFAGAAALPVAYILEVARLFSRPDWAAVAWRPGSVALFCIGAALVGVSILVRARRVAA